MQTRHFAYVKANWHSKIVNRSLEGFLSRVSAEEVEVFDVPGAFEMPLMARDLAKTGKYDAVVAAALVVDGGIYRHEFVAQAVVDGLMRAGLETGVPILSVSLTPHHFHEGSHHEAVFYEHFFTKGAEAADAALLITRTRSEALR
ncbi:6,7-dimethyl-8-ribityllumazine synthase [Rhizobium leguminosarum]|uniref:6,7-dimethyl-8-ribityllumazine synthase n=1 Tax=Rhizobium leguminosarum TaxID=384 RepID=UPI00098FEC99|nr:6,7-dimethyl-8-ribityllumazine synthase [Rhizobium leguminosarum]ASS58098.1 riboflavin synthase subunit beta [Rhizobium leguminosarum bv. viciae]MBB4390032.1 6,7-dimethyl-8-ribityllumazine synthase [Rhizobium leguminosarum]MBB4588713.1 6,7-dimethyl-8-ribityllumazine synthase [Rhizobium leguminosarum]MBB5260453.1 6,7-dimethyl-8-ribityllumazine synthase [Rhizobium leguminosarum]MBY5488390.1 6,7-dimethyl-8-ribityllumazine synthase [Rhizobium leguminosarum]